MSIFSKIGKAIGGAAKKVAGVAKSLILPVAAGGVLGIPGVGGVIGKIATGAGSIIGKVLGAREQSSKLGTDAAGAAIAAASEAKQTAQQEYQAGAPMGPYQQQADNFTWMAQNAGAIKAGLIVGGVLGLAWFLKSKRR